MSHLVGIDKGPVMDWTNDSGLDEWYRKWKKHVEVLFKGPLHAVLESIKCNYVVYWSGGRSWNGPSGTSGPLRAKSMMATRRTLNTYWTHFEELHTPQKTNKLIAVVELK